MGIVIVEKKITKKGLLTLAPDVPTSDDSGKMVKAVVDISRCVMAVGGDVHAEMKELLVKEGSLAQDLWGVRIHFWDTLEASLEFVSQINYRPADGNSSLHIRDVFLCGTIRRVMQRLIDWSS